MYKSVLFILGIIETLTLDVLKLLSEMTLEEKIGQLIQIDIQFLTEWNGRVNYNKLKELIDKYHIGSIMNSHFSVTGWTGWTAPQWRDILSNIYGVVEHSNSTAIPILYGIDSIHGASFVYPAAIFPQQIAIGATFNDQLAYSIGRITSKDTRAAGIPWLFSPVLGISFSPLWPRFEETFGEDPYLASRLGVAMIKGIQDITHDGGIPYRAAACMKHFIGYSAPINGHDRSPVFLPDRFLHQIYQPIFESAIQAGVLTAMEGYHEVDGIPIVSSSHHLKDKLRHEMNFTGVLVTDYAELYNLHNWHKASESDKDSIRIALSDTSIDIGMLPGESKFFEYIYELVKDKVISESRIDESVTRILSLKNSLGLFDEPNHLSISDPLIQTVGQNSDWDVSLETSREALTLLKNLGNILPLPLDASVLLTGPTADSLIAQTGGRFYNSQFKAGM
jgi:beta-glucosidase